MPKFPPVPPLDLCLYHWTPTRNRNRIKKVGLTPGRLSLQGDWRPPYICFSDDPILAWSLSGEMYPEIKDWDLWMVWGPGDGVDKYEIILDTYPDTGRHYVKEYRVYYRIPKRYVMYVGSRSHP